MGQLRRITGLLSVLRLPALHQLRRASVWLSIDGSAYVVDSFARSAERKNPGLTMVMWIANRATSDASDSIRLRLRALYQPVTPLRPGSDSSGVNVVSRDMDGSDGSTWLTDECTSISCIEPSPRSSSLSTETSAHRTRFPSTFS